MRGVIASFVVGVAALTLAAGCGGGGSDQAPTEGVFAYDHSADLGAQDNGHVTSGGLVVRDLSFATPSGQVSAFLVTPKNAEHLPAVIYVHGAGGDRTTMLGPAVGLAAHGAAALLITAPSSVTARHGKGAVARLHDYRDTVVADVVAVRRAIDLLAQRPEVDASRIGYVGWSAGARTGAIVAGVESRLHGIVLMSAGSSNVDTYVQQAPASLRGELRRTLDEIDPLRWIAKADAASLLLQAGRRDRVVPRPALDAMITAAPKGTALRWYDAGHELNDQAYAEHLQWLQARLGF